MKLLQRVAAAALGFVVAAATVFVHHIGGMLVLAAGATVLPLIALPAGSRRVAYALGWITALAVAITPWQGGGYLVGSDTRGYLVLGLGLVLICGSIATLPLKHWRRLARHDERAGDADDVAR